MTPFEPLENLEELFFCDSTLLVSPSLENEVLKFDRWVKGTC